MYNEFFKNRYSDGIKKTKAKKKKKKKEIKKRG